MSKPTNSNVNQTELYQNQLLEYRQNHQKLKKESQVNARQEKKEVDSNRRLVEKGFKRSKKSVSDRIYVHANPKRGVEACVDIGNVRLSHEISSQDLKDSFGRLTKGLHRFNPVQKRQEPQTKEIMGINPAPASQSKIQNFDLTLQKLAAVTIICYYVYRTFREIGPPCWNFVSARLWKTSTTRPEPRFEVKPQVEQERFKSQQKTVAFLQNNKKSLYKFPEQDTERRANGIVCIKCQLEFPSNLLSEKAIQENRGFVVATCNLPKYNLSAGLVGCVVSVDKANWMEVLFLPKEGPWCHLPWLEEAAQLWPFALLTNSVDDVKKSFDLKRAKQSEDRKEYVFDIQKEWTGVTT